MIVVALLLFIVGWVALCGFGVDEGDVKDISAFASLMVLLIVFGPAVWAGGLIGKVLDRD